MLKKFQTIRQTHDEIPKREIERTNERVSGEIERNSANFNTDLNNETSFNKNITPPEEDSINPLIRRNNDCHTKKHVRDEKETCPVTGAQKNNNRNREIDIESSTIDKCGRVLCIESHFNGVTYEEYVFKFSVDREIKIKYPVLLNNDDQTAVRMEFVDNVDDYEVTSSDRMLILFKNIYAVVNVKQTGVPCSTQTMKMKTSNNFTQTALTGINSFSRLNVGVTMLNSEKRAIERSLCNLERTVKALKSNALNQAETMIGKNSHLLADDEMLNYIKVLTQ